MEYCAEVCTTVDDTLWGGGCVCGRWGEETTEESAAGFFDGLKEDTG